MSLLTKVRNMLLGEERRPEAHPAARRHAAARHPDGSNRPSSDELPLQLRLLDLAPIRHQLGEQWPQRAEKVKALANRMLLNRIGDPDFFSAIGDDAFVIGLRTADASEASLRTAMLCEEVTHRLVGSEDPGQSVDGRAATPVVRELRAEDFADAGPTSVASRRFSVSSELAETLRQSRTSVVLPGVAAQMERFTKHAGREISRLERLIDEGQTFQSQSETVNALLDSLWRLERDLTDGDDGAGGRDARHGSEAVGAETRAVGFREEVAALVQAAENALGRSSGVSEPEGPNAAPQVVEMGAGVPSQGPKDVAPQFLYAPLWYASGGALGMYRAQMIAQVELETLSSDNLGSLNEDRELVSLVDRILLQRAVEDVVSSIKGGRPCVVCIPLHHVTLTWPRAQRVLVDRCRNLPPTVRRSIVWDLLGIPAEAWSTRLRQDLGPIVGFGRATFLRVPIDMLDGAASLKRFGALRSAGVTGVGVDVLGTGLGEETIMDRLDALAEVAERNGLRTYALGLERFSLATAALGAGVNYLGGAAVSKPVDRPLGLRKQEAEKIFVSHLHGLLNAPSSS